MGSNFFLGINLDLMKSALTTPIAVKSTVSSNVTGIKEGTDRYGFPPNTSG